MIRMSEEEAIRARTMPVTRESILADLRAIGVMEGVTLFVQSSLSSMGWVCGGPVTVIHALMEAVGPTGTLCMPTMAGDYSDPAIWSNPPVPEAWWHAIRGAMPAFDDAYTPSRRMGTIAETFRTWPGAVRSGNPHTAISALGPLAHHITKSHPPATGFGPSSPLEQMVEAGGYALLIGTQRNTTLHLAEATATFPKRMVKTGVPLMVEGIRTWVEFDEIDDYADHFPPILEAFKKTGECTVGTVGNAESVLFKERPMVEFGRAWMESYWDSTITE